MLRNIFIRRIEISIKEEFFLELRSSIKDSFFFNMIEIRCLRKMFFVVLRLVFKEVFL